MATPVKEKNGKTYGIRVFRMNNKGEREQKYKGGFKNKSEALAWKNEWTNEFQGSVKNITFNDFVPYFLELKLAKGIEARTHADYQYYINILQEEFGSLLLKDISPSRLQSYLNSFKKTQAKCRHIKSTLSSIFSLAFKQEIIETNPMLRVEPPKYEQKQISFYDNIQSMKLLGILKNEQPMFYPFALLLIITGMRPNEATVLQTSDIIKTENNEYYISINKALSEVYNLITKETQSSIKKPKTAAGVRAVPLNSDMLRELNYFKDTFKISSSYVICDQKGQPITLNCFHQAIKRAIKRHSLPHITPYGLRHTFGNLNKRAGVDSFTVSKLMGHSDPKTTEQNYYHNDIKLNISAIEKVTALLINSNSTKK